MEYKDYYKIMGLARDASAEDIKRAHRKLARQFHPDVSKEPDAEARFKELSEAYEVLRDPDKRSAYDQLGPQWRAGQDFQPPPDWGAGREASGRGDGWGFRSPRRDTSESDFSDFFDSLFGRDFQGAGFSGARGHASVGSQGRARQGRADRRGPDHHAKILIDLKDAYCGASRTVRLQRQDPRQPSGMQAHEISFWVPRGVRAGQRIRLAGQGGAGSGQGPAGDLLLEVAFNPPAPGEPAYRLDKHDVYLDLPISPWEAALGATVEVPTPTGWVAVVVPPGSPPGRKLRLKGRGLPAATPGDLYLVLLVSAPPAHREVERSFYRDMAQRFKDFDPRQAWRSVR